MRSERSVKAIVVALGENPRFDAINFEHDTLPLPRDIVPAALIHSDSLLVLFENPNIARYGAPAWLMALTTLRVSTPPITLTATTFRHSRSQRT